MKAVLLSLSLILTYSIVFSQNIVNHKLQVDINPETSQIYVTDEISGDFSNSFLLNSIFTPKSNSKLVIITKMQENTQAIDVGMDRDDTEKESDVKLTRWEVKGADKIFTITYNGNINISVEQSNGDYQRGFSQTSGIINSKGTYLAGSTYWVPAFNDKLITYTLTTELPKDWKNVTTGKRIADNIIENKHIDTWQCDNPQEEIFLIAAKFTEYTYSMNNGVKAMAFLRTPDEGLANKYLSVTEQYMEMYQKMLGKYPYSKFALVENFWETGYGMPSFTLLGEKIIRFPFILHSSYPHELLHNWWGNSVYVDFDSGNWCEGITVFMADHLIKEQRNAGESYRRSTLQKYSNVVNTKNDFPLNKFLSRYDEPSSAIGYGKAMMLWQMLRRKLGDELFLKGVHLFNKNNKYKVASYNDMRIAMEEVSGLNLKAFFNQWVNRKGAPELELKSVNTNLYAGKYRVNVSIEQIQTSEVFNIDIPINIATENGLETFVFNMDKKQQDFQISLKSKPLKLVIDPQYDVFRILHPSEVPATLTKIWSSEQTLVILPTKGTKQQKELYKKFVNKWQISNGSKITIKYDTDYKEMPTYKTVWVLGFENKFAKKINTELINYNSSFLTDSVRINNKLIAKKGNSFIVTVTKKHNINMQNLFIAFDNEKAIDGLVRKLPHYGKYSYLVFNGNEPTNFEKGQWPVLKSPLVKLFSNDAQKLNVYETRKPLAQLKPIFSANRIMSSVKYLASKELKGRGIGTPEIDKAAEYIASKFKEAGLKPLGNDYYQQFIHKFDKKGDVKLKNIIGIIEGTDPKLKDEAVVISAHYDHLGLGWPDVHKGDEGKIHYGADDNASGVAIMIELAKTMAKSTKPKRTIVFLACTAEEAGLIGSRYFVKHSKDYFSKPFFANVNLDTDGSLFDKKLLVLNGNSAKEWKFIFMGTDYTTGIKSEVITQDLDASDQVAFIEKGIPAVQLFTGATAHYHRPSDKIETLDSKGMVKVATVAKEVIVYLADREDPMHYTGSAKLARKPSLQHNKKDRKVSTGSVPDFTFKGKGVRLSSVVPNSEGEKAGLKAKDIIIELNGNKVTNLKDYSILLKQYKPKDVVKLKILRLGKEVIIKLTLGER